MRAGTVDSVKPLPAFTTSNGITICAIQGGSIAITPAHYELRVPAPLRLAAILADRRLTSMLPLNAYLIDHPEGRFLVDVGETVHTVEGIAAAGRMTARIIASKSQLEVSHTDEVANQLRSSEIDPASIGTIVVSHLHFDHVGGLASFPGANVAIDRAEFEQQRRRPMGALTHLWPSNLEPQLLDHVPEPEIGLPATPLTAAGDLLAIGTPGHSYGHQSVLLRTPDLDFIFGGDMVFDEGQLLRGGIPGISYDVAAVRESRRRVLGYLSNRPTVYLPAHDPDAADRLQRGQTTAP